MKPKAFNKKLFLNKKTIADLDSKAIGKIYGGRPRSDTTVCVQECVTECVHHSCDNNQSQCFCPITEPFC
jgi:hypothetical protein